MSIKITPIPIYQDNYVWAIQRGNAVVVVDPGDAMPVINFIEKHGLTLHAILVTHKHWDHVTGIEEVKQHFNQPTVYGPCHKLIPAVDKVLKEGNIIEVLGIQWTVLDLPGHTMEHIGYCGTEENQPYLFSGDNIFSSGCGRMYEGTAKIFQETLNKLSKLPESTLIYGTHEYTVVNIDFALSVEPNNTQLLHKQDVTQQLRAEGKPTLPTTLREERATNPFLRWDQPDIIRAVQVRTALPLVNPDEIFGALREWKDHF